MSLLLSWKDQMVSFNTWRSPPNNHHISVILGRFSRYYDLSLCTFKSVLLKVILLLILFSMFINKMILKVQIFLM